jgi:hypothetical protein
MIRYVGLDLLFTSSPLYPPYFTANRIPGQVNFDVNTVEGWNQVDASQAYIKPALFLQEVKELPSGFESTLKRQDFSGSPTTTGSTARRAASSALSTPTIAAGYGLITTMIHEYGHHSSLSHPHDGYDPGTGVDFGPGGDTFFAWPGDESNSMMSYIDLNWDFSQFDCDNSARHHAAGYAKIANIVADDLVGIPAAAGKLAEANTALNTAQAAFATHNYATALQFARQAYHSVVAGAGLAGVDVEIVEPSTWTIVGPVKPDNGPGKAKKADYGPRTSSRRRTSSGCSVGNEQAAPVTARAPATGPSSRSSQRLRLLCDVGMTATAPGTAPKVAGRSSPALRR